MEKVETNGKEDRRILVCHFHSFVFPLSGIFQDSFRGRQCLLRVRCLSVSFRSSSCPSCSSRHSFPSVPLLSSFRFLPFVILSILFILSVFSFCSFLVFCLLFSVSRPGSVVSRRLGWLARLCFENGSISRRQNG